MKNLIEPKILKGFRDFLPAEEIVRKTIINQLEKIFESFGFLPIDTPALEYAEILLGKSGGETEKQVYRFFDQGEREVALRFDLTVPFARYLAQHRHELQLPFKRYHIAKVWRGEKPHAGRFREFVQCDFDLVGVDNASADFEIMLIMFSSLQSQKIEKFKIHFSHRGLLCDFLQKLDLAEKALEILRQIDKAKKITSAELQAEIEKKAGLEKTKLILDFIQPLDSIKQILKKLTDLLGQDSPALQRCHQIYDFIKSLELTEYFTLDCSITRGLDYYTGIVFESFIEGFENLGSVCSGGRYDNLVGLYLNDKISGVGASVGLDRLITVLEKLKILPKPHLNIHIIIPVIDLDLMPYYHRLAQIIRQEGFNVEVFHEKKKLASQFTEAEKKGIRYAVLVGGKEKEKEVVNLRDLQERKNYDNLTISDLIAKLKQFCQ